MEHLEEFVNEQLEHHYNTLVEEILINHKQQKHSTERTFKELIPKIKRKPDNLNINKVYKKIFNFILD